MRRTAQVDVSIVGLDVGVLTDETMYDEHTGRPSFSTREAAEFFFGRPRQWLYDQLIAGHIELDAEPVEIPYAGGGLEYRWRLVDVERTAVGLAQGGYLDAVALYRALSIVRLVAESYGYLPTEVELMSAEHDPAQAGVSAVATEEVITDDLDGTEGAAERTFAVGGVEYTIDLTDAHWNELCALLRPYIEAARTSYRKPTHPRAYGGLRAVREWAREHGYDISATGPVPRAIHDAFLRAQR